jgi:hypothetical protein
MLLPVNLPQRLLAQLATSHNRGIEFQCEHVKFETWKYLVGTWVLDENTKKERIARADGPTVL